MFRVIFLLMVIPFFAGAKQKICLNMIVKNESEVIKRCLDSVKPVIDYWVIIDTGSTDGTQKIIKNEMKGIPGKLYERRWKNFGENRSEAFTLAKGKGDYILFMDADDVLEFEGKAEFPHLIHDLYNMWRGNEDFTYLKPQLAKGDLPWKWVGVTHEYLDCDRVYTSGLLKEVKYVTKDGGASSNDPKKFLKNVKLLEEGLVKEPGNVRYMFYLAESYRDSGDYAKALQWYQKRVDMGGWAEEIFWAKFQIGQMLYKLGLPLNIVIEAYKNAHESRPHRPEPIYFLADLYNQQEKYQEAYDCLKKWEKIPQPAQKDGLFNFEWIQKYGMQFQLSICSYYVGQFHEALNACDRLLALSDLPTYWRELTESNRTFPANKLIDQVSEKQ
jgi:glycosyltransferase involved in cell wall biosynthesis